MIHTMARLDEPEMVLRCPRCSTVIERAVGVEEIVCWQCGTCLTLRQHDGQTDLEVGAQPAEEALGPEMADLGQAGYAPEPIAPRSSWGSWALGLLIVGVGALFVYGLLSGRAGGVARSADGVLELSLPAGWRQTAGRASSTRIAAVGPLRDEWVFVESSSKEDFGKLGSYDAYWQRIMLAGLSEATRTDTVAVVVNGHPALRWEITGTDPDGRRWGYLMTAVETDTRFSMVTACTARSRFPERKAELGRLAGGLREVGRGPAR